MGHARHPHESRAQVQAGEPVLKIALDVVPANAPLVTDDRAPRRGRWWVHTQTAMYLLDLERRKVTRFPDANNELRPEDLLEEGDDYAVSQLRLDSETIPLVQLMTLALGEPMILVLDIRRDGVLTVRPTTPVRAIVAATATGGDRPEHEDQSDGLDR